MKISVALSGGGVRAMAHLGVIRVLLDNGFEIGAVSGASGGALVGALFCDGRSPEEIVDIMKGLRLGDIARFGGGGGLFGLKPLEKLMESNLNAKRIEELTIPFTLSCTDLTSGCVRYFDSGPAAMLCTASSSLVPIFSPVRYGDSLLADGGFMDNMPTSPLKEAGYPIVGINVNPISANKPSGIIGSTIRVSMLMMRANIEASGKLADFYIEPEGCGGIDILDLKKGMQAYEEGISAARSSIDKLKSALGTIEPL